jgi:hypothetical protein
MTCIEAHQAAGKAIDAAVAEAGTCMRDEDCMLVLTDTKCYGSCESAIAAVMETAFNEYLDEISEAYCGDPDHDSLCGYVTPGCAFAVPRCSNGHCIALRVSL